ncbi:S-adenosyl-l-methionine hydroxide adenosyltransferase family protein [Nonlabens sp. SY33080]|uniref:SAM hydrolase/SAM-dependent halogenase family protein n=1 Tax=Nonlabens sp. SY33080 TaxID=2719911 RepID=UPI0014288CA3|nr:SAM-dependent chlorinase/fluorinase [Nonlabens sp. SY33080]
MPIITLTTDFGYKDPYAGAVKGAIYSQFPDARIVDISHDVTPFSVDEAAFMIYTSYSQFPKGTVHVIGVDAEHTPESPHIAALLDDHYFVCADNGVLSFILQKFRPTKAVVINIHDRIYSNFTVLDAFVQVACHIKRGGTLEVIGEPITELKSLPGILPILSNDSTSIRGKVIFIDNYGNAITNISRDVFESYGKGRNFILQARDQKFIRIYNRYSEIVKYDENGKSNKPDGKGLALFNNSGYLELATYKSNPLTVGSASSLFGLEINAPVTIQFES